MSETAMNITLAVIGAISGSTLTAIIQGVINRRKNKAEVIRVNTETLAVDVKNRQAIEEFYSGLLGKREDLAEQIYDQLIALEQKLAEEQKARLLLKSENEKLIIQLHNAGLSPLTEKSDASSTEE